MLGVVLCHPLTHEVLQHRQPPGRFVLPLQEHVPYETEQETHLEAPLCQKPHAQIWSDMSP